MKRRILFVDDEPKVLSGLRRMLYEQASVWEMVFATTVGEAMEVMSRTPFEVVVLDISMPEKNGFELLKEIKANPHTRNTEVVVLTGLQDERLKQKALDLGANDLLNKPVLREDLIARLNSVLRIRTYQDELRAQNAALEQELIQSQKMEVVGMLAAGVVHDLKNILMVIRGHSELAVERLDDDAPVLNNLKNIRTAVLHAQEVVREILGLTKRTKMKLESCRLDTLVSEVLALLRATISKEIQIEWNGEGDSQQIQADRTQMYQLLMNLCLNAVQAMESGGILRISLSRTKLNGDFPQLDPELLEGTYVKLEVSDTGEGMDEVTLKHMFDPLFTTRASQEGTGVGLSVVQRIVRNHGGLLKVESQPGQGTTFMIFLPATEAGKAPKIPRREVSTTGFVAPGSSV
jgi:signal transduction histidine kinase